MSKPVINRYRYFLPWLLLWSCLFAPFSLAKLPTITPGEVPDYDYTQTQMMVLHGPDGYVFLANPFEHPAPNMGALVYEMILLYVPHLQPFMMPPEEPTHVLDLIMKDQNNIDRLGQRLYIGNPWLSDGKSIALMTAADYQKLAHYLDKRYVNATTYDAERYGQSRRPTPDELPQDWLAEPDSIRQAIQRLPVSDYEGYGYDPGARIRQRTYADMSGIDNNPASNAVELQKNLKPSAPQFVPAAHEQPSPDQSALAVNLEQESLEESRLTTSTATAAVPSPEQDRFLPALVMLLGLLLLTLLLRRQRRKKRS